MDMQTILIIIIVILASVLLGIGIVYWTNQEAEMDFLSDANNFKESDIKTKDDLLKLLKKAEDLESFKITMKEVGSREQAMSNFFVSGSKIRMDFVDAMSGTTITTITDFKKTESYTYYPKTAVLVKKEAREEESFNYDLFNAFSQSQDLIILGDDIVDDKKCVVVEFSPPLLPRIEKVRFWIWKEYGLSIKIERLMKDGERIIVEQKIEFVDIPEEIFIIPKNIHTIEM